MPQSDKNKCDKIIESDDFNIKLAAMNATTSVVLLRAYKRQRYGDFLDYWNGKREVAVTEEEEEQMRAEQAQQRIDKEQEKLKEKYKRKLIAKLNTEMKNEDGLKSASFDFYPPYEFTRDIMDTSPLFDAIRWHFKEKGFLFTITKNLQRVRDGNLDNNFVRKVYYTLAIDELKEDEKQALRDHHASKKLKK